MVEKSLEFPPRQTDKHNDQQLALKQVFFHLDGTHPQLPSAEIAAILESEQFPYQVIEKREQCLIVNCSLQGALRAAYRAAYCKRAVELLTRGKIPETAKELANFIAREIAFNELLKGEESFRVRVHYVGTTKKEFTSKNLEPILGKIIWQQTKGKCKGEMKHPSQNFVLLFVEEEFLFGKGLYERPKGSFVSRQPTIRPFFKPGTLEPRFARLMVNLAMANPKGLLLDPFCGPGGILIEGLLMGCQVIGVDIDRRMIKGAKSNIQHYAPKSNYYDLLIGDARQMPLRRGVKAIATDPPYGRSTSTFGEKLGKLLQEFLEEVNTILLPRGILAIGMVKEIPLREIGEEVGLELLLFDPP